MKKKILVVGDMMIDRYIYVNTTRQSQESSVPIYDWQSEEVVLGGAANVAANVCGLSDPDTVVHVSGIVNFDVVNMLADHGAFVIRSMYGLILEKLRYVVEEDGRKNIVFRFDDRKKFSSHTIDKYSSVSSRLDVSCYDVVVISDYDKGTISDDLVERIVRESKMVIVDSKRNDLRMFRGAHVLNVNLSEFLAQQIKSQYVVNDLFKSVVVTMGEDGSAIFENGDIVLEVEADLVKVADVTGCGDTYTAALAVGLSEGMDLHQAARFATRAATFAVQKFGSTKVKRWDLETF